jgi:hypothetical protein
MLQAGSQNGRSYRRKFGAPEQISACIILAACRPSFRKHGMRGAGNDASLGGADQQGGLIAGGGGGSWQSDLSPLSGGQRTLVSLALLLAVARAAAAKDSGGGLLVLDEVDAALDEHNQVSSGAKTRNPNKSMCRFCHQNVTGSFSPHPTHRPVPGQRRVAELLLQLARGSAVQLLCVSHNPAFQAVCDATVTVAPPTRATGLHGNQQHGQPAAAVGGAAARRRGKSTRATAPAKRARVRLAVA